MTRTRDGLQRVPLMSGIGSAVFVYDITHSEMAVAAARLLQYAAAHGDPAACEALGGAAVKPVNNNVVPFPAVHPVSAVPVAAAAMGDDVEHGFATAVDA